MSLTHAILGVIEARAMTGYELGRFFDTHAGWVWSAPRSQIYPRLRQMERDGLIEAESQIRGTRLERRVYSITAEGVHNLREWICANAESRQRRDQLLLQALYFDLVDPDAAIRILQRVIDDQRCFVADWEQHAARLRERRTALLIERLRRRPPEDHDRIVELKAHAFIGGIALAKARIEWAEAGIRLLTLARERD